MKLILLLLSVVGPLWDGVGCAVSDYSVDAGDEYPWQVAGSVFEMTLKSTFSLSQHQSAGPCPVINTSWGSYWNEQLGPALKLWHMSSLNYNQSEFLDSLQIRFRSWLQQTGKSSVHGVIESRLRSTFCAFVRHMVCRHWQQVSKTLYLVYDLFDDYSCASFNGIQTSLSVFSLQISPSPSLEECKDVLAQVQMLVLVLNLYVQLWPPTSVLYATAREECRELLVILVDIICSQSLPRLYPQQLVVTTVIPASPYLVRPYDPDSYASRYVQSAPAVFNLCRLAETSPESSTNDLCQLIMGQLVVNRYRHQCIRQGIPMYADVSPQFLDNPLDSTKTLRLRSQTGLLMAWNQFLRAAPETSLNICLMTIDLWQQASFGQPLCIPPSLRFRDYGFDVGRPDLILVQLGLLLDFDVSSLVSSLPKGQSLKTVAEGWHRMLVGGLVQCYQHPWLVPQVILVGKSDVPRNPVRPDHVDTLYWFLRHHILG
jgi:hypothetical protein